MSGSENVFIEKYKCIFSAVSKCLNLNGERQIDRQMDGQTGQQTGRQTGCEWKTVGSVERMFLVHTIKLIFEQEIKEPSRCQ